MLIKSIENLKSFEAGDKTELIEVLHPRNDALVLPYSLAHASIEIGESSLPHVLKKCSEVYYILEGIGMMVVDGEKKAIKKNDVIYVPKGANQYVDNQGDTKLVFLCIVAPPWYEEQEKII